MPRDRDIDAETSHLVLDKSDFATFVVLNR